MPISSLDKDAMTRVKICGLMGEEDVQLCVRAGADSLGFVTEYPIPVPWNISRKKAGELAAAAPPFVTTTAVVGGPVESILEIAHTVKPHFIQLHGDETLAEIQSICSALRDTGIKVLKALRIDVDSGKALFSVTDPIEASAILADSGISALVVDSKTSSRPAGTGVPLNWKTIQDLSSAVRVPLILAGGLSVENVSRAIELVRPYGVDVISGVEKEAGLKDENLVRDFIWAAKRAHNHVISKHDP
jgi:phosphoribosylanthranilate isomerase